MAGGGVGEAALAAEALGAAEVAGTVAGAGAGAGFLEGMAGVSALEGAGVAGLGLGTGAGLTTGAGLAGGLGSLSPAFQTALAETAVANPSIAAQFAQAANAGAVPSAATALGTGQIGSAGLQGLGAGQLGDPGLLQAAQGAGNVASQGLQASSIASAVDPATAQLVNALQNAPTSAQLAAQYGTGTQLASVGNAGVGDALARGVAGPGEAGWGMDLGAAEVPFTPGDPRAAIPPVEGMLDAATGRIPETPGIMNLLSKGYDAWKNSDPFIKYGSAGLAAAKYLGKPTSAYAPPGYSGPLSKINISPNYRPYSYRPYAAGGPVEEMSRENAIGANTGYPQADIQQGAYATPWQTPVSRNVVSGAGDANVDQMTGLERMARGGVAHFEGGGAAGGDTGGDSAAGAGDTGGLASLAYSPSMYSPMMYSPSMMSSSLVDPATAYAEAQPVMSLSQQNLQNFFAPYANLPGMTQAEIDKWAASQPKPEPVQESTGGGDPNYYHQQSIMFSSGGVSNLGGYSDGGRLLRGPGDGMSDNIPASISGKQPARLADGEFVVPADVVSGLGNGSTDAGAKHLYNMMDKVRKARTGTKKQGKQINPRKYLPA